MKIYKAFIIDDDQENIDILKILLKQHCLNLEIKGEATNIYDGLDICNDVTPGILFLDIKLQGTDTAFDLIDGLRLKENKESPCLTYIFPERFGK